MTDMHEYSIVGRVIEEAKKQGSPKSVTVVIGDIAGITPEEFRHTFTHMAKWGLEIETEKASVRCNECGFGGSPKIIARLHNQCLIECPQCGSRWLKVISGGNVYLKSVKVK